MTNFLCSESITHIIHFMPLISFDTRWKHQKTRGFLMISGGTKRDQWHEIGRWDCRGVFRTLPYIHDGFFLQKWWTTNYFLKKAVECLMFDRVLHSRHLLVFKTSWRIPHDMSWRPLKYVFSVPISRLPRCLQEVVKTSRKTRNSYDLENPFSN